MSRTLRLFTSRQDRWRTVAYLLAILLAWGGLALAFRRELGWLLDPLAVRDFVRGFGVLGPVVFVLLQASQVVFAPIPGQVLGLAAGYLFGALVGTLVSVVGATVGSYVAFRLARRYGRSYVERVVAPDVLDRFDGFADEHGLVALFVVFLVPGLPDDVICFVAGLSNLDVRKMTAVSFFGRIPGYFVVAVAGAGLARERFVESAGVLAVLVGLSAVVYLGRERLLAWIERG